MQKLFPGGYLSRKISTIFLCVSLLFPWQVFAAVSLDANAATQHEQLDKNCTVAQLLEMKKRAVVHNALGELSCAHTHDSIIGKNERKELQLGWLVDRLGTTQTSFGRWALQQMVCPIADEDAIKQKQEVIKLFVEDTHLCNQVQQNLQCIAQSEQALIKYWDAAEYKEQGRLFNRVESFYFSLFKQWFPNLVKRLNGSSLALEGGVLNSMFNTCSSIFYSFGLYGLMLEVNDFLEGRLGDRGFDPLHGLFRGFKQTLNAFNPLLSKSKPRKARTLEEEVQFLNEIKRKVNEARSTGGVAEVVRQMYEEQDGYDGSLKSYWNIMLNGTAGDRFNVGSQSCDHKYKVKLPGLGEKKLFRCSRVTPEDTWLTKRMCNVIGLMEAVGPALWTSKFLYERVKSTKADYSLLIRTMNELRAHMKSVAQVFDAIKKLNTVVQQHPALESSCIAEHMNKVFGSNAIAGRLERLRRLLDSSTFKSNASFWYSRGRVLLAHKLMKDIKNELVPALQAIAELDAYYTLATKCKPHNGEQPEFTFVEFVDAANPFLELDRCKIPVLDKSVENSISFGGEHPSKLVITGPNGGGKSTLLKMLGHFVVLAQSLGIAPAAHARSTIFTGLRTCLHPEEDLMNNMSTFMAEKKRIDELDQFMNKRAPGQKLMLLLDEPFKGTVDAESAERIYQFGKKIAHSSQSIVCIATHVKKPVSLEYDTQKAFANLHVGIAEYSDGTFERLFTLCQGPASWWFEDTAKRARYIDWLGTQYELAPAA